MAVSGKTAAPWEVPYFLGTDKPPDMAAVTKAIADRVHAILAAENEQSLSWLKSGAKKQLIICDKSGVPQYVTMGGDGTIDESGSFQLGAGIVEKANLAPGVGALHWYPPKVVTAEEARASAEFGFLTTEDKISGVELAEDGLMLIFLRTHVKSSVSGAGHAAVFLNGTQLKTRTGASNDEGLTSGTGFGLIFTSAEGLTVAMPTENADVATGQILGPDALAVYAAAGTYTVGVKYKASSGSVTAKERRLMVATLG